MGEEERSSAQQQDMWEAFAEDRWGGGGIADPARRDGRGPGARTSAGSSDGHATELDDAAAPSEDDALDEDTLETGPLSVLDVPSPFGGAPAPAELLRALGRLLDTLNAERRRFSAAEERARELEVKTARLEAILVAESEMRRRAEEDLSRLRAEIEERRRRIDQNVERMLARRGSSGPTAGDTDATDVARLPEGAPRPDAPAGASGPLRRDGASPPAPSPAPGGPPATEPSGPQPSPAKGRPAGDRGAPPPPPTPETTVGAASAPASEATGEPPPLLPGWRYASELEAPRRRWPWRLRSRERA
jgi:hypothetical protein